MRVQTKAYGPVDVDERQKILFPFGILGFENLREYVLLDAVQQPFYWLQSLEVPEIAFVLINPKVFRPDYTLDIQDGDLEELELDNDDGSNTLVFAIVTIPENHSRMTANLQGPIIINREKRIGRQSVSINDTWKVRHYILDELAALRNDAC
ncbi:MAG: flagellar assembly protein FliW [Spirochaetales bacterium]|nr:flagellar assembly protein FliW [Spirochaetales bacterium]